MYDRNYYEKNKEYLTKYQRQYYYKKKLKSQNDIVKKRSNSGNSFGMMIFYFPVILYFD